MPDATIPTGPLAEVAPSVPRLHPAALTLLLVGALVVLLAHLEITVRHTDRTLLTADAGEFAIAGRQLERTGRLSTLLVSPGMLTRPVRPPFPVIVGQPLVPLLDAALFSLGGEHPELTLIPAGLAYLAVVAVAALLALRVSGSAAAAWLAGAAVAVSGPMLYYASEGLTEMPFAALLTAILVLLWDLPERPRYVLLGACLGLGHLARPVMPFLLPGVLVGVLLLSRPGRRVRGLLIALAVFAPALVLWMLYKWIAVGSPTAGLAQYNLLSYLAPEFAPWRVHRWIQLPEPWGYVLAHPGAVARKLLGFGPSMAASAINPESPIIALLFLFHLISPARDPRVRRFRVTLVVVMGLLVGLVTLTRPSGRYLAPLWPAVIAMAVSEAWLVTRRNGHRPAMAFAVCTGLILFAWGFADARAWHRAWSHGATDRGAFRESDWRAFGRMVAKRLPRDAVVVSDVGTWISWYADRATLALPDNPDELRACEQRLPLDAMVLSNEWLIYLPDSAPWCALYRGTASLPGWVRADSLCCGRLNAVLFLRSRGGGGRPSSARQDHSVNLLSQTVKDVRSVMPKRASAVARAPVRRRRCLRRSRSSRIASEPSAVSLDAEQPRNQRSDRGLGRIRSSPGSDAWSAARFTCLARPGCRRRHGREKPIGSP